MSPASDSSPHHEPWIFVVVAFVVAAVVIGFGLGFLLLPRYGGAGKPYSVKDSVYHALGLHVHDKGFGTIQPPLKIPTHIAWTQSTIRQATSGDPKRGESAASSCSACHVEEGPPPDPATPKLAGLDRLVLYKQLDDFRSGTRSSDIMAAIAQSMSPQDSADVAAYYSSKYGLLKDGGERPLRSNSGFHNSDPIQKLIYAGDPKRGIAACAACHGRGGYLIGAPSLINQNALYLEQQLQAFAQGTRANDMNMPMRTITALLTPAEMKSLAAAYSSGFEGPK
jgi:cytochrome c553